MSPKINYRNIFKSLYIIIFEEQIYLKLSKLFYLSIIFKQQNVIYSFNLHIASHYFIFI